MEEKSLCEHCNITVEDDNFVIKDKSFTDLVKSIDRKDKKKLGKHDIIQWLLKNATPTVLPFLHLWEVVDRCLNCNENEMVEILKLAKVFVKLRKHRDDKEEYNKLNNENLAAKIALSLGNPEILEWILNLDCNQNVYEPEINMLLLSAARKGKLDHVKVLVNSGANLVGTLFEELVVVESIAREGLIDIIKWIVNSNAIEKNHTAYIRALHAAFKNKHFDVVECLMENTELDLNAKVKNGRYPSTNLINLAAEIGNINLITWLIEKGVKLFIGNDNKTIVNIAVENGHTNLLKWLQTKGGDVNSLRSDGKTLLHLAASKGQLDCVKYLVHKKWDINAKDKESESVLHCAVASENIELVKFLIAHGANVHVVNNLQNTLLHRAHDSLEMLQMLVPMGIDLYERDTRRKLNVLNLAACGKNYEVVCWLLKQGMDIKDVESQAHEWLSSDYGKDYRMLKLCVKYVNESNEKKYHPVLLVKAARNNKSFQILVQNNANFDVQILDSTPLIESLLQYYEEHYTTSIYLLQQGVNVTYKSFENGDALYISIKNRKLAITQKIVELGGDVNTRNFSGYTALGLAVSMMYMEAIQYLVSQGANINAVDPSGRTVLNVASELPLYENQIHLIKCLIELGADPNYYNQTYKPMLCKASENQDIELTLWLLNNGAEANLLLPAGPIIFECLDYFTDENRKLESLIHFLNHGVDINVLNNKDETLLFPCIENIRIVEYLINQEIDINYVNINSRSALHEALDMKHYENNNQNQVKIVLKMLYSGADITIADASGKIPLHLAAANKHCGDIARLLVQKGTRVNAKDAEGNSVLHVTCQGELAMWLCENGADINAKNDHGVSVLHSVIKRLPEQEENKSNLNIISLLANCTINIDTRKSITNQYIESIASSRYMKYLEFLVEKVQDVEERDENGMTAMHYAVTKDNNFLVSILVKRGVNILNKSRNGNTVLHSAASSGSLNVATYILDHMKHELLLKENNANETPLHLAIISNHVNIVNLLLKHGVEVDHKTNDNMTALHLACKNGNVEIVKLLLSNGANLYESSSNSCTPIHMTVQHCKFDVFEYLLEFESQNPSSEPNVKLLQVKTDSDENLLHVAAKYGRLRNVPTKIMHYLINNQVYPIDSVDKLGNSALHHACCTYVSEAVELLVDNGANINLKNNTGNTPLHFAARTARPDVISYLMLQGANSNAKNKKGNTPVHIAVANKRNMIISDLVDKSIDSLHIQNRKGNSAIHMAAVVNTRVCEQLDNYYFTGSDDANYNIMNQKNQSPLHFAAKYLSIRVILNCVTKENINAKDKYGNTPLHAFLTSNSLTRIMSYISICVELCKKGSDLHLKNKFGQTAMHIALGHSDLRTIPHLVPYVTNANIADRTGHNILHAALYNMDLNVIQQLFPIADLNAKTNDGETYLHIVINNPHRDVLDWLVPQCTSIINEKDDINGETVLLRCVKYNLELSIIELFVANGADINTVDNINQSPLQISEIVGRPDLVDYFSTAPN